jgi:hypothetical protein
MLFATSASASFIDLAGTDAVTGYDAGTKVLSSGADSIPGTVVEPNSGTIFGADINFSIVLDGTEASPVTIGSRFVGANVGSADVWVVDPVTFAVLLTIEVHEIFASNVTFGSAGVFSTSMNFGGIDPDVASGQSDVTITGGDLAGDFGGIGTSGLMFILLDTPTTAFNPGGAIFSSSFTAQTNTQFNFLPVPEPSTAVLLAGPLMGMGLWRRGTRLRNKL